MDPVWGRARVPQSGDSGVDHAGGAPCAGGGRALRHLGRLTAQEREDMLATQRRAESMPVATTGRTWIPPDSFFTSE